MLAQHGFVLESARREKYFCNILFGNGERYIWISARVYPRKKPGRFDVFLGEGRRDYRSRNANAVALGELRTYLDSDDGPARAYVLQSGQVGEVVQQAQGDLVRHDGGFLSGHTENFHSALLLLNGKQPEAISGDVIDAESIRNAPEAHGIRPGRANLQGVNKEEARVPLSDLVSKHS